MNWLFDKDNGRFLDARLSFLTRFERDGLTLEWKRRSERNSPRSANIWLRKITERAINALNKSAFMQPLTGDRSAIYGDKELRQYAEAHARECNIRIQEYDAGECYAKNLAAVYGGLAVYAQNHDLSAPYMAVKNKGIELYESALLKMSCPKWWLRQLKRQRRELREYIQLAIGRVGRASPYISKKGLLDYRDQQRQQTEFINAFEALSEDGEVVPLAKLYDASSANPEKRRIELMVRARGLEELADELSYQGLFLTITTPSKYHQNSKKWQGTTPADAQAYLVGLWAQVRAVLSKQGIEYFGLRVAEPHGDATPHWHMLIFVAQRHEAALKEVMRAYALKEDGNERGAAENRFDCVTIDKTKGSAVGYIAKYIAKNINGERMTGDNDIDLDAQTSAKDGAERARAWASTWRIRQFQFFGAASVSVWRELRRLKTPAEVEAIENIRQAADAAKWAEFQRLSKQTPLTLSRIDDGVTEYNEQKTRIVGVELKSGEGVVTRLKRWVLQKSGGSRVTWTRVNNCNLRVNDNERSNQRASKTATGRMQGARGTGKRCANYGAEANFTAIIEQAARTIALVDRGVIYG